MFQTAVWLPFREAVKPPLFVPVFRDRVVRWWWPIIAKIPDPGLQKAVEQGILGHVVILIENVEFRKGKTSAMSVPARLHIILARRGSRAVVFRRGPSDEVAVIGWDRGDDSFRLGQWLRGRIYPYRCDLSPSGEYLIYFAAKYGRENPVENLIWAELEKHFHTADLWRIGLQERQRAEEQIRREHAREIQRIERSENYHDRSWTAISRAPYLKALSLWWNGTGWNGGGLWKSEKEFYLNRPPEWVAATVPGIQSRRFGEVPPSEELHNFGWGSVHGECPMVYQPRLERDNWNPVRNGEWGGFYHKELPGCWKLEKAFVVDVHCNLQPGKGVYQEIHKLFSPSGENAVDTTDWEWADFDRYRRRVTFACRGALYALDLKTLESKMLYDFNEMKYQRIAAPY